MAPSDNNSDKVRPFPKPVSADAEQRGAQAEAPAPGIEAAPQQRPANDVANPKGKTRGRARLVLPIIILAALAGAGWYGYDYFSVGRFMVSTDDAYIAGDIAQISPKLGGYVASVDVVANQRVKAGAPLVTLDDGDYRIAAEQAQAQIATQRLTLDRIDAQITGARAAIAVAEAQKTALAAAQHNAQLTRDRAAQLNAKDFSSQAELDKANAALDQANANLTGADAQIAAAKANVAVLEGQRAEAESALKTLGLALDKANRDLSFTVIRAPYDGVVGNLAVQKGDLVAAGARLMALVPTEALYIDANFKETQLAGLAPGEKVAIHVDALDAGTITGTVQSIAPASGSVFSLLPPENATGNFTKVVQRVPVRIALPADALASGRLRAGLSVVVDADTRTLPTPARVASAN